MNVSLRAFFALPLPYSLFSPFLNPLKRLENDCQHFLIINRLVDPPRTNSLASDGSVFTWLVLWSRTECRVVVTHGRQLGYHDAEDGKEIDGKVRQVIMGVVRAQEEEDDGDTQEELLRRGVLVPVVDLLPQVQVVVSAGVEFEGNASDPVEHQV